MLSNPKPASVVTTFLTFYSAVFSVLSVVESFFVVGSLSDLLCETSPEFDVFLWEGQNDRTMKIMKENQ